MALVPSEAFSPVDALRIADQRMYEQKAARSRRAVRAPTSCSRSSASATAGCATISAAWPVWPSGSPNGSGSREHEIKQISLAAKLHDVGKTAIPDEILNKPGPLDEDEWEFMRRHTVIGERIILAAPSLAPSAGLVRSSHERFDGTGYPDALSGGAIPLGASIIAVCDAFDAMVSKRPYRAAMSTGDAVVELRRCAGKQFDPRSSRRSAWWPKKPTPQGRSPRRVWRNVARRWGAMLVPRQGRRERR